MSPLSVVSTLFIGIVVGYLAQRSRMCFIGGIRDFILVRDMYLLKGLVSLLVVASLAYPALKAVGGRVDGYPWFKELAREEGFGKDYRQIYGYGACDIPKDIPLVFGEREEEPTLGGAGSRLKGFRIGKTFISRSALIAVAGGIGVGVFSTLANGCPLRQHVLASQGCVSSAGYLAGFYAGAIVFHTVVVPLLEHYSP